MACRAGIKIVSPCTDPRRPGVLNGRRHARCVGEHAIRFGLTNGNAAHNGNILGFRDHFPILVLIDDVIARGATFLGAVARIVASFPGGDMKADALVGTQSHGDFDAFRDSVEGQITTSLESVQRDP